MNWQPGFRTKAIAGFSGMVAATVVVAVVSIAQARRSAEGATRAVRAEAEELLLTQRLRYRLERIVADGQGYLLFGEEQLMARVHEDWNDVVGTLQKLDEKLSSPVARAQLRQVMQTAGAYRDIVERAMAEREANHDIEALLRFERRLRTHQEDLDTAVDQIWSEELRSLEGALNEIGRSSGRGELLVLGTALTALVVSLLLARIVVRELARLYEREARAAKRAQDALAARDDLLAIIAHDLRSPLSAILLRVALIRKRVDQDPSRTDLYKHLETLEDTAQRMDYLIKSLLDAGTIEAGRLSMASTACDVPNILRTTFEMFEPLAALKSIELHLKLPLPSLTVWADRERVLQVLSNLVSNAIKFTPEGGVVTLWADALPGHVRFAVSDVGVGIAEDQRPYVFERYWKGKKGGRVGAGLGLFIARGIVEGGQGRIWFETKVAEGTTFFFTLPSAKETASTASPPSLRREALPRL